MKGQNYQKEVDDSKEAIAILGGTVKDKILYNLPQERGMRCLIKIKKYEQPLIFILEVMLK